jgi:hypothetical protein
VLGWEVAGGRCRQLIDIPTSNIQQHDHESWKSTPRFGGNGSKKSSIWREEIGSRNRLLDLAGRNSQIEIIDSSIWREEIGNREIDRRSTRATPTDPRSAKLMMNDDVATDRLRR